MQNGHTLHGQRTEQFSRKVYIKSKMRHLISISMKENSIEACSYQSGAGVLLLLSIFCDELCSAVCVSLEEAELEYDC